MTSETTTCGSIHGATLRRLLASAGFRVVEEVERGPLAHLDRYVAWRALFHGVHAVRLGVRRRPGVRGDAAPASGRRLVVRPPAAFPGSVFQAPWRVCPGLEGGSSQDFLEVNRELYADQASANTAGAREARRRCESSWWEPQYPDSFADNLVTSQAQDAGHDARVEAPFRGFVGGTHRLAVRARQGLEGFDAEARDPNAGTRRRGRPGASRRAGDQPRRSSQLPRGAAAPGGIRRSRRFGSRTLREPGSRRTCSPATTRCS